MNEYPADCSTRLITGLDGRVPKARTRPIFPCRRLVEIDPAPIYAAVLVVFDVFPPPLTNVLVPTEVPFNLQVTKFPNQLANAVTIQGDETVPDGVVAADGLSASRRRATAEAPAMELTRDVMPTRVNPVPPSHADIECALSPVVEASSTKTLNKKPPPTFLYNPSELDDIFRISFDPSKLTPGFPPKTFVV